MGLRCCGVFSLVSSLLLVCGGVMGSCLWPHIAQSYFSAISCGTLILINGILVMKISDVKNQFLSEISVVLSVSLISIPMTIYTMCCLATNMIEFIGTAVGKDLSHPLGYLIKQPGLQDYFQTLPRTPTLAVAIIDVTLMSVIALVFVNCIITVVKLRTLLLDRETDKVLHDSWYMSYRTEGERDFTYGMENPAYGCNPIPSGSDYSPQDTNFKLPRTDPRDFHREPPRMKKRQLYSEPHVTWPQYVEDSLYM